MESIKNMIYNRRFQNKQIVTPRVPTHKLVAFEIGTENYAIPLERVRIILKEFMPFGALKTGYSLVRYQDQVVIVIDLWQFFVNTNGFSDSHYLIVCTLPSQEYLGIPIPQMPKIVDVPADQFSEVPELYRQAELPKAVEKLIHTSDAQELFYLNIDLLATKDKN